MRTPQQRIYDKRYKNKNRDKIALSRKVLNLRTRFGMSLLEYQTLSEIQNHRCAICNKKEMAKSLAVDHCHKTRKNRGLLCQKCNRGIGCFSDDLSTTKSAVVYLQKYL